MRWCDPGTIFAMPWSTSANNTRVLESARAIALESNDLETWHPMSVRNPYAVPGTFRKAQLHCHTTESDGRFKPRDLLAMFQDAGYAFVCITDAMKATPRPVLKTQLETSQWNIHVPVS